MPSRLALTPIFIPPDRIPVMCCGYVGKYSQLQVKKTIKIFNPAPSVTVNIDDEGFTTEPGSGERPMLQVA